MMETVGFDEWLRQRHGFTSHLNENDHIAQSMRQIATIMSEVPIYLDYVTTLAGVKRTNIVPTFDNEPIAPQSKSP